MNASPPLVSVLVPTIGRPEFFDDLLRSVRQQTYANIEVVVLDNASGDDAARAFAEWARTDSRVRVRRLESRVPVFRNLNRGIAEAKGKYVVFFHDDDVYAAALLARAVDALEAYPRARFFASNYDFVDERGVLTEKRRWIRRDACIPGRQFVEMMLHRGRGIVVTPGVVFRRSTLDDGFDERLSLHYGDYIILMRMAERGDVYLGTDALVSIRRHAAQQSLEMSFSAGDTAADELVPRLLRWISEPAPQRCTIHSLDEAARDFASPYRARMGMGDGDQRRRGVGLHARTPGSRPRCGPGAARYRRFERQTMGWALRGPREEARSTSRYVATQARRAGLMCD